jgi:hypothetical protein
MRGERPYTVRPEETNLNLGVAPFRLVRYNVLNMCILTYVH